MNARPRVLWFLFVTSTLIQLVGSFWYFVGATGLAHGLYFLIKVIMIGSIVLLVFLKFPLPVLSLGKNKYQSILFGVATGTAMVSVILLVFFVFRTFFNQYADEITLKVTEVGVLEIYWIVAIFISLVHSLFEEIFWRWYVVGGFASRMTQSAAMLIGNALFVPHHVILLWPFFPPEYALTFAVCVGVGGLVWSYVFQKTGSLLGAWTSHAMVDLVLFTIGWILIT